MKHTILTVTKESAEKAHIKSLPVPLMTGEKVIVAKDQSGVSEGFVRVKHGNPKVTSIFNLEHFRSLNGKRVRKIEA